MPRSFLIKKTGTGRQFGSSSSSSSNSSNVVGKTLKPCTDLSEAIFRYTGTIGLGTKCVTSYASDHSLSLSLQSDYESRLFSLSHYGDNGMRSAEDASNCSSSSSSQSGSISPSDDQPLALDTHRRAANITSTTIPSSSSSSISALPSPVSAASSPPSLLIPAKRSRASGFQSGITVGYTYEAFFVTDGRSRRRNKLMTSPGSNSNIGNGVNLTRTPAVTSPPLAALSPILAPPSDDNNNSVGDKDQQHLRISPNRGGGGGGGGGGCLSPALSVASPPPPPPSAASSSSESGSSSANGRPRYNCADCGKSYATSSNLSRHKQTHRNMESQQAKACPHCSKTYVSMPALSMHILTHDLRHGCTVCGKAFSRPWLLQGHMRSHTGEKPYGCAHCGKAFADRSNLRAHMQTHSPLKHFRCKRCHKTFALKSYLNKHSESACVMRRGVNGELAPRDYDVSKGEEEEEEEGEVTSFDDVEVDVEDDSCDESSDEHLMDEESAMSYAPSATSSSPAAAASFNSSRLVDFKGQLSAGVSSERF